MFEDLVHIFWQQCSTGDWTLADVAADLQDNLGHHDCDEGVVAETCAHCLGLAFRVRVAQQMLPVLVIALCANLALLAGA